MTDFFKLSGKTRVFKIKPGDVFSDPDRFLRAVVISINNTEKCLLHIKDARGKEAEMQRLEKREKKKREGYCFFAFCFFPSLLLVSVFLASCILSIKLVVERPGTRGICF